MKPKGSKYQINGYEGKQEGESETDHTNQQKFPFENYKKLQAENKRIREELCQKIEENISMQNRVSDLESKLEQINSDNKALRVENAALKDGDIDPNDEETFPYSQFTMEEFADRAKQIETSLATLMRDLKETAEELGDRSEQHDHSKFENFMERKVGEHRKWKEDLLRADLQYNSKQNITGMVENYKTMCRSNDKRSSMMLSTVNGLSKKVQNKSKQVTCKINKISEEVRLFAEEITKNLNGLEKKCIQDQTQKEMKLFSQVSKSIKQEIELFQRLIAVVQRKDTESDIIKEHSYYPHGVYEAHRSPVPAGCVIREYTKQEFTSDDEY